MNKNEQILSRLISISDDKQCDLIEAATIFCEEADISEDEFILKLDDHLIEQLRYSAITNGRVRKCVAKLDLDVMKDL